MGRFEQTEMMKKITFAKNAWYDWLIKYNPDSIKERWVLLQIKISVF